MMMLGQLIASLAGERDSWDLRSLTSSAGGLGGGGQGGGLGGGGLGGGGFGGGFRSVSPIAPASALVRPGQTRRLPTPLVSLSAPSAEGNLAMPRPGEPLAILDIDAQASASPRLRTAVKRLAQEQAPQTVAQLVLWNVRTGLDWSRLEPFARRWANPGEFALARRFVTELDATSIATGSEGPPARSGFIDIDLRTTGSESKPLAAQLRALLDSRSMLGLKVRVRPTESPQGPALACQVQLDRTLASVRVLATDEAGTVWRTAGKFSLALTDSTGNERPVVEIADALALGVLDRLVRVELTPGRRVKGQATYKVRIDNSSPLVLSGLALGGSAADPLAKASLLLGIGLPPKKSLAVPASTEVVKRLGLTQGVRILAVNLTEL